MEHDQWHMQEFGTAWKSAGLYHVTSKGIRTVVRSWWQGGEKGLRGEKRSERKRTAELARDHKDLQDRHRPKGTKTKKPEDFSSSF